MSPVNWREDESEGRADASSKKLPVQADPIMSYLTID